VIWGSEGIAEPAAIRWRCELNENAKVPAFSSVLPELDHNEVEGWSPGAGRGFGLVILRHHGEHASVGARVQATLDSIEDAGLESREAWAARSGPLASVLGLIMVGDLASTYLAILRGVDPTPIPVLTGLKERLRP
jgi:glucose/mannose-6-phosphate isomerase